jgi:hypothetical protein
MLVERFSRQRAVVLTGDTLGMMAHRDEGY